MKRISTNGLSLPAVFLLLCGTVVFAQLPGDLDANGEVNLADLAEFVGCLNGPDGVSLDPGCDPRNFDPASAPDADVDLRDFAGFQTRFGFGQGPPQIVSFSPTPGEWVVDDLGLTEVTIGFSEPVILPLDAADAVNVWGLTSGTVAGFTTSYDPDTFVLTVSFATPLRNDQVTAVVDFTIEDVAGHPLDGEILDPINAPLPSGNGINGGQGVFRIRVLQGDANRDGIVDAADETLVDNSLNHCAGDPGFDAMADLNADGCVDATDANIVANALGKQLPVTDGVAPSITMIRIDGSLDELDTFDIHFSELVSFETINEHSFFLVDNHGQVLIPSFAVGGAFGTSAIFFFDPGLTECLGYTINISNSIADSSLELLSTIEPQQCQ